MSQTIIFQRECDVEEITVTRHPHGLTATQGALEHITALKKKKKKNWMYWYQKVLHNTREQPSTVGDSVTLYFDLDSELNFHAVRYLQAP